jgi:hypothetical protein
MSRIELNYTNYDNGYGYYITLKDPALEQIKNSTITIKNGYEEDFKDSIFDITNFPIGSYLDDYYDSIVKSEKMIDNAETLAHYAVDNFKGQEEAIEEDINKFRDLREELFDGVGYAGFHYQDESLVYWEPGTDGYTPQGYTETDEYKIVSAYKKGENSRLYYYDKETGEYVGYVELNNQDHVGGIAYDLDDNLLFVTGDDGKVNCYDHERIETAFEISSKDGSPETVIDLNCSEYKGVEVECDINIKDELKTSDAATIYYHDGKLYVSTYRTKGDLVSYDINCTRNGRDIDLDVGDMHVISHDCPAATQGIAIFERNGKQYVAFSRSAAGSPSSIDVYELNDDGTLGDFSGSMEIDHKGLEGIKVDDDGTITGIYEYEGTTSLNANIDDIIDNGQENKNDQDYISKADFWNKSVKKNWNSSYEEALEIERIGQGYNGG